MLKQLCLFTILSFCLVAHAQEEQEHWELQDLPVLNAWLPFSVSANGEVSFLKSSAGESFIFSPIVQIGGSFSKAQFNLPQRVEEFTLEEETNPGQWLEVHRRQYQVGAGLGVLLKTPFKLGIIPFKGGNQKLIRVTSHNSQSASLSLIPKNLREIEQWHDGDRGIFETFGGVELQAGMGLGFLASVTGGIALQNEFILEITKVDENTVSLSLSEGRVKRRRLSLSVEVASVNYSKISGKKLVAQFLLDLNNQSHHELYQEALRGRLAELQRELPHEAQRIEFRGSVRTTFVGIPVLIGKDKRKGNFEFSEEELQSVLHFETKRNVGLFLPKRNLHRYVNFVGPKVILFWATEMKKVKGKALNQHFLSIGRSLGLKGFEVRPENDEKFGSVLTQIGLSLDEKTFLSLNQISTSQLETNYALQCEELRLKCRKLDHRKKILGKMTRLMHKKWSGVRKEIGALLMKNPALLHSLIKTLDLNVKAYYLFLSSRFKSKEGMVAVEL